MAFTQRKGVGYRVAAAASALVLAALPLTEIACGGSGPNSSGTGPSGQRPDAPQTMSDGSMKAPVMNCALVRKTLKAGEGIGLTEEIVKFTGIQNGDAGFLVFSDRSPQGSTSSFPEGYEGGLVWNGKRHMYTAAIINTDGSIDAILRAAEATINPSESGCNRTCVPSEVLRLRLTSGSIATGTAMQSPLVNMGGTGFMPRIDLDTSNGFPYRVTTRTLIDSTTGKPLWRGQIPGFDTNLMKMTIGYPSTDQTATADADIQKCTPNNP
ncbi:hypothetical protein HZC07_01530 [Candidatus Micrarchaeota archaeon]|nr:hypothetical protein [Candidatus Micrarchaeota archaeon]